MEITTEFYFILNRNGGYTIFFSLQIYWICISIKIWPSMLSCEFITNSEFSNTDGWSNLLCIQNTIYYRYTTNSTKKKTVRNYIHISHFQETHIYIQISTSPYFSFEDPQFLMLCNEQELTYYDELMVLVFEPRSDTIL